MRSDSTFSVLLPQRTVLVRRGRETLRGQLSDLILHPLVTAVHE